MMQVDTKAFEERIAKTGPDREGPEATVRMLFWLRLCNLLATVQEFVLEQRVSKKP